MSNTSLLGSYGDNSGAGLMFRNLLVNGSCSIDQRNAGANQTITAAANIAYTVDRWYAYCTGANVVGARVASTGAYQFTGAASVTGINFGQRIEAANSAHLAGQTATLSVDLSNSVLTTVTWTAYYANTNDTFGQAPASFTRTQIATGTFTVSSTVTRYSASFAVPGAATTGIDIMFSVGAQTSGTWRINNAMLEPGPTATPFERRPIGVELALCQRYYEKSFTTASFGIGSFGTVFLFIGGSPSANDEFYSGTFKVAKRDKPVITIYGNAATGQVYNYSGGVNNPATATAATDALTFTIQTTGSTPRPAAGNKIGFGWEANAEL